MPLKRARYIHFPVFHGWGNGFSAEISPLTPAFNDDHHLTHVLFRITICSSKDQFSRSQARRELTKKEWKEIRVVDVPKFLAAAAYRSVHGFPLDELKSNKSMQHLHNQWAWVYKYFL
jgi:hypothetical protein